MQADISACTDGTLHIWSTNSNLARPDKSCETAHEKGSRTSGVVFARDGRRLATRGGDDTVKCESFIKRLGLISVDRARSDSFRDPGEHEILNNAKWPS